MKKSLTPRIVFKPLYNNAVNSKAAFCHVYLIHLGGNLQILSGLYCVAVVLPVCAQQHRKHRPGRPQENVRVDPLSVNPSVSQSVLTQEL